VTNPNLLSSLFTPWALNLKVMSIDHILIPSSKVDLHTKKDSALRLPVRKNELVEGRVVKSIPPHHALLEIKGKQVVAQIKVSLRQGDIASFKVQEVNPQYILKLVEVTGGQKPVVGGLLRGGGFSGFPYRFLLDILEPLMTHGGKTAPGNLTDIVVKVWALLQEMSLGPDKVQNPRFLHSFILNSGMLLEHKLKSAFLSGMGDRNQIKALIGQDLKALVLGALSDPKSMELFSAESTKHFLDSLEQLQFLNLSAMEDKGKCLFIIPMYWGNKFKFAQLLIDLGDKSGSQANGGDRVFRLSLLLDMSSLGPVRADVSILRKVIKIDFVVCNEEVQRLFDNSEDYLRNGVEKHGFSVQQITCVLEEYNILAETSLIDDIIDPGEHHISLII